MVYQVLFIALAVAELAAVALIFLFRDMMHSVLSLAMVFFVNSLLFLFMGQPLLALVQLFVMIGGVSTFLFVGVASAEASRFRHTSLATLVLLSAVLFVACFYRAYGMQFSEQQNVLAGGTLAGYLATSMGQMYVMALAMFGVTLGAIMILRRIDVVR